MAFTAFVLGFAGSLHCLGMCSPLAMAVTNQSSKFLWSRILYNLGRILTYGVLGSLVSSFGLMITMSNYQNVLSILLGIALIMIGAAGISTVKVPMLSPILASVNFKLKNLFSSVLKNKSAGSTFVLGSLNGFLPCGLSFLALTSCLTLAGPVDGFNFMLLFGLGTLPVMLGFTTFFRWLCSRLHFSSRSLTTGLLIVSGLLLIARVFIVHLPNSPSVHEGIVDIVMCR